MGKNDPHVLFLIPSADVPSIWNLILPIWLRCGVCGEEEDEYMETVSEWYGFGRGGGSLCQSLWPS
eukprot:1537157-Ditylum_brightwellii.AAC.1